MNRPNGAQKEADLLTVVLGIDYLEKNLDELIHSHFGRVSQETLPVERFSFGLKTNLAYNLNLLTQEEYADLKSIEKIHQWMNEKEVGLPLDETDIAGECQKLTNPLKVIPIDLEKTSRILYKVSIVHIGNRLITRANCIKLGAVLNY